MSAYRKRCTKGRDLTAAEFRVYMLIACRAMTTAKLAQHLNRSKYTIAQQKWSIFRKMGVTRDWQLLTEYWKKELL